MESFKKESKEMNPSTFSLHAVGQNKPLKMENKKNYIESRLRQLMGKCLRYGAINHKAGSCNF